MFINILLIIAAIILIIGLIRVILRPSDGILGFLSDIILIDWITDILGSIFNSLSDSDWD